MGMRDVSFRLGGVCCSVPLPPPLEPRFGGVCGSERFFAVVVAQLGRGLGYHFSNSDESDEAWRSDSAKSLKGIAGILIRTNETRWLDLWVFGNPALGMGRAQG